MPITLSIPGSVDTQAILYLIHTVVDTEIARLQMANMLAQQKLATYEKKYNVSSQYFMQSMAVEDLDGGDDEYVDWMGELRLYQKLLAKLHKLQSIQYVAE